MYAGHWILNWRKLRMNGIFTHGCRISFFLKVVCYEVVREPRIS